MKKYTIEELKKDKISIHCNNAEQANKIINAWNLDKSYPRHDFQQSDNFDILYMSQSNLSWNQRLRDNVNYFKAENYYDLTDCIEFSQIDFQENLVECIEIW